ncbi:MAG: acetylxylan esterase [Clostridia bacterium]|nr:acetylxylan esterase [Clostridia bacterium]
MLKDTLASRDLLPITQMNDGTPATADNWSARRAEMLKLLETHSYGVTPPAPAWVKGEITREYARCCAGKALEHDIDLTFPTPGGDFTFPLVLMRPLHVPKPPVFLYISFSGKHNNYIPVEEIIDNGFAFATFCYLDVVNDKLFGDYSDGLAKMFGVTKENRTPTTWGKIGMWAYGASRALDYLLTRDDIDARHTAVIGHSRLGKTALWAAAQDERFYCAISNNSGYGGAATSKHGEGERVADFIRVGSWDWYCENFKLYGGDREDSKPYDQAHLLALVAPRLLCVGSALLDKGADPKSEFITTAWASSAWELLGQKGLVCPDRLAQIGDHFMEGSISYHLRDYQHYLSRYDWQRYMAFLESKLYK